jgi:hypothetical protein
MTRYKKTITIGFSKPNAKWKKPISRLIRVFELSEYSHVYIKITNGRLKNDLYYHASGTKVHFMGKKEFKEKNKIVEEYKFDLSAAKFYKTLDFAIGHVGQSYSYSQLIGLVVVRICGLFGKKINNPFGGKGYICTELVAEVLRHIHGREILKDINTIGLKDIKRLIENS